MLTLLGAFWLLAQAHIGAMRGTVTDQEGTALPGITITITSPTLRTPRIVVTDENGQFEARGGLPVGVYTVEASLASFTPTRVEGVRMLWRGVAMVKLVMKLDATTGEQTWICIHEEAFFHASDRGTGGDFYYRELERLPVGLDVGAALALVPGVQMDGVDVGGSRAGRGPRFAAKGSVNGQAEWTLDGVPITDAGEPGSPPSQFDPGAIEDIQVQTSGADIQPISAGMGIHLISKRGSNELHGSARASYTHEKLQSDNLGEPLRKAYPFDLDNPATAARAFLPESMDRLLELGLEAGGPIVKDRAWFWLGASAEAIDRRLGQLDRQIFHDTGRLARRAEASRLRFGSAKLSVQISESNEASAFVHAASQTLPGPGLSLLRDSDAAWRESHASPILILQDQEVFGSTTLLSAKAALVRTSFELEPGGSAARGNSSPLQAVYDARTGAWTRNFKTYSSKSPQAYLALDGSHFAVLGHTDNDFKFGGAFRSTPTETRSAWDGGGYGIENFGSGYGEFVLAPDLTLRTESRTLSLFASDQLMIGSLTLDLGLRYDRQTSEPRGATRAENPLLPQYLPRVEYKPAEPSLTYSLLSPRIGLTCPLGERTYLKSSYALYADQLESSLAASLEPLGNQYLYADFQDANADHQAQPGELIQRPGQPCGGYCSGGDPATPPARLNRIDSGLSSPRTRELSLGLARELPEDSLLSLNLTYRVRTNTLLRLPLVTDASGATRPLTLEDWTPLPPYPFAGTPDGDYAGRFQLPPATLLPYALKPGVLPTGGSLLQNRAGYSEQFLGLELNLQKYWGRRWSGAASLALNDWTQRFTEGGAGDFPDPNVTVEHDHAAGAQLAARADSTNGIQSQAFLNARWQAALRGVYTIPGIELQLGAVFSLRQGYPSPFSVAYRAPRGAIVTPTGGRTVNLLVQARQDATRMPSVSTLDLRLGRAFHFGANGRYQLEASASLFNALNAGTPLQHQLDVQASDFARPLELLAPRTLRFTGRFSF